MKINLSPVKEEGGGEGGEMTRRKKSTVLICESLFFVLYNITMKSLK